MKKALPKMKKKVKIMDAEHSVSKRVGEKGSPFITITKF